MSGMRRVYDPRLVAARLGSSRWGSSRWIDSPLGWSGVAVDEVGGRCTLFGGGLLTRRLSTCGVGELCEPYNALLIQASVHVDCWGASASGTEGRVRVIGSVNGDMVVC
jgi:hypothetical protein